MNVIKSAQTNWTAPIVFALYKDGALRFCVDHRKLKAVTIKDSYLLPRMDKCMESLGDAQVFSTLDASSGYWKTKVEDGNRDKMAFKSHNGPLCFICTPFRLAMIFPQLTRCRHTAYLKAHHPYFTDTMQTN